MENLSFKAHWYEKRQGVHSTPLLIIFETSISEQLIDIPNEFMDSFRDSFYEGWAIILLCIGILSRCSPGLSIVNICLSVWDETEEKGTCNVHLKVTPGNGVQTEQRNRKKKHCLIIKKSIVKAGVIWDDPSHYCPKCISSFVSAMESCLWLYYYCIHTSTTGWFILHIIDSSQGVRGKL